MYRIYQLKLPIGHSEEALKNCAAKYLGIKTDNITGFSVFRRSVDARDKNDVFFVYAVDVNINCKLKKKFKPNEVGEVKPYRYSLPEQGTESLSYFPVVIGAGPAGLFCAYILAMAGYRPLLFERGKSVDERQEDVDCFLKDGILNPDSNVLFGEGGAGTFSDGKLNTLIKDKDGYGRFVLETFVKNGAKEEILYDAKPHIGTDVLRNVVKGMREEIIALGGKVSFKSRLSGFTADTELRSVSLEFLDDDGKVISTQNISADVCVLATGHSARDTFEMLYDKKVEMQPKPFAIGLRAVHPQEMINKSQYGAYADKLPAASYKLTHTTKSGRGVYSFCMCPGGYVINSSSEPDGVVVNGMSYSDRNGKYANSAIICNVTPEDYEKEGCGTDPLSGVRFQRKFEKLAYKAGNGKVPVSSLGKFSGPCDDERAYTSLSDKVMGECERADLRSCLPEFVSESISEAFAAYDKKIQGFGSSDTLLCGIETRTSSPVKILRDGDFFASVKGIIPAGEGPGYAGGIMSAAIDGIKAAEHIIKKYSRYYPER